jgi:hypothetical protein
MKCPICKKEVKFNDPFMPFCSDRCKEIDLGNWASEKYVIPGDELPPDESPSIHSPGLTATLDDEEN